MTFTILYFRYREGNLGTVTLATEEAELYKMRPFDAPLPETLKDMGWMTRKAALKLATQRKLNFLEF